MIEFTLRRSRGTWFVKTHFSGALSNSGTENDANTRSRKCALCLKIVLKLHFSIINWRRASDLNWRQACCTTCNVHTRTCDVSLACSKYFTQRQLIYEPDSIRLIYCEVFNTFKLNVIFELKTEGSTVPICISSQSKW